MIARTNPPKIRRAEVEVIPSTQARSQTAADTKARPARAGMVAAEPSPGMTEPTTREAPTTWSQPSTSERLAPVQPPRTDRQAIKPTNGAHGQPARTTARPSAQADRSVIGSARADAQILGRVPGARSRSTRRRPSRRPGPEVRQDQVAPERPRTTVASPRTATGGQPPARKAQLAQKPTAQPDPRASRRSSAATVPRPAIRSTGDFRRTDPSAPATRTRPGRPSTPPERFRPRRARRTRR